MFSDVIKETDEKTRIIHSHTESCVVCLPLVFSSLEEREECPWRVEWWRRLQDEKVHVGKQGR